MTTKTLVAGISIALTALAEPAIAAQGPSSSAPSYLLSTDPQHTIFTSLLTTGDSIGGYRMAGIPDGLGAFDNGDGTFTVLMNHEIVANLGNVRAHGAKGAFVSEFVIDKATLSVLSGRDLIQNVFGWDTATQSLNTTTSTIAFTRFCSADLAPVAAFYNKASGLGSQERIFMNGEEGGPTGFQVGTVVTGKDAGNAYILGKFNAQLNGSNQTGVPAWENALANPFAQDKTIVIANSDTGTGVHNNALALYVGTKTNTGTEVDKAGLTNGTLKFVHVDGVASEIADTTTRATSIVSGTRFALTASDMTQFSRPEDGAWSLDGDRKSVV